MLAQDRKIKADVSKASQIGMTLESLETASFWANASVVVLTGLLAIAGVFAWTFTTKLGAMKDEALTNFKVESAEKVSAANARAEEAKAESATSLERAAQAEVRAAEANLALARFRASRTLPQAKRAQFIKRLKPFSGTSYIVSANGSEPIELARDLWMILGDAGWELRDWPDGSYTYLPPPIGRRAGNIELHGVHVWIFDPKLTDAMDALLDVLRISGIEEVGGTLKDAAQRPGDTAMQIMIGTKR